MRREFNQKWLQVASMALLFLPVLGCDVSDYGLRMDGSSEPSIATMQSPRGLESRQGIWPDSTSTAFQSFKTDCHLNPVLGTASQIRYEFTEEALLLRHQVYSGVSCRAGDQVVEWIYFANYQTHPGGEDQTAAGAIDLEILDSRVHIYDQRFVRQLNAAKVCGRQDYRYGEMRNFTGLRGTPGFICPMTEESMELFGAFALRGETLYLNYGGVGGMASQRDHRPAHVFVGNGLRLEPQVQVSELWTQGFFQTLLE